MTDQPISHTRCVRAERRSVTLFLLVVLFLLPNGTLAAERSHRIKNVIVIYQENWSFDSLYGLFPGANGISRYLAHIVSAARPSHREVIHLAAGSAVRSDKRFSLPQHAPAADQQWSDRHSFSNKLQYSGALRFG